MYSIIFLFSSSFFFFLMIRRPPRSTLFPYTTLFRSHPGPVQINVDRPHGFARLGDAGIVVVVQDGIGVIARELNEVAIVLRDRGHACLLQVRRDLPCRTAYDVEWTNLRRREHRRADEGPEDGHRSKQLDHRRAASLSAGPPAAPSAGSRDCGVPPNDHAVSDRSLREPNAPASAGDEKQWGCHLRPGPTAWTIAPGGRYLAHEHAGSGSPGAKEERVLRPSPCRPRRRPSRAGARRPETRP